MGNCYHHSYSQNGKRIARSESNSLVNISTTSSKTRLSDSNLTCRIKSIDTKKKICYTFNATSIHEKDKSKIELKIDDNKLFAMRKS